MKKIATASALSVLLLAGAIAPAIAAEGDPAPLTGVVSGVTYLDTNGNGTYDAGVDKPAMGTLLSVVDAEGNPAKDAEGRKLVAGTDKDGAYVIPGVTNGYKLVFTNNIDGYTSTWGPQTISFTEDKLDKEINWPLVDPNAPVKPDAGAADGAEDGKADDKAQSEAPKGDKTAPAASDKDKGKTGAGEAAKPNVDGKGADADKTDKGQSSADKPKGETKTGDSQKSADKSKGKGDAAQSGKAKAEKAKGGAKPGLAKTGATTGFLAVLAGATGALGAVAIRTRKR